MQAAATMGPATGFIIGGLFLKIYVDIDRAHSVYVPSCIKYIPSDRLFITVNFLETMQ